MMYLCSWGGSDAVLSFRGTCKCQVKRWCMSPPRVWARLTGQTNSRLQGGGQIRDTQQGSTGDQLLASTALTVPRSDLGETELSLSAQSQPEPQDCGWHSWLTFQNPISRVMQWGHLDLSFLFIYLFIYFSFSLYKHTQTLLYFMDWIDCITLTFLLKVTPLKQVSSGITV